MDIPTTLLNDLQSLPRDSRAALLMRHSARYPILDPNDPNVAVLTPEGICMAEEFGAVLAEQFQPGRLLSSPVGRCLATAEAIARGAGWPALASTDVRLSHPFISPAWILVSRGGLNGELPFQVRSTLGLMLEAPEEPALDILVTHDTIVAAVAGSLLRAPVTGPNLPGYLEGVFLWRAGGYIHARWRGEEAVFTDLFQKAA